MFRRRPIRSTPAGEHLPVMLYEVLEFLAIRPGGSVVDCTMGFAGHSLEMLKKVGPTGRLWAFDLDSGNIEAGRAKLTTVGENFRLVHGNFAGFPQAVAADGVTGVDGVLADLGMSSMQVDDPDRGFSFNRDGPLDMRMDRTRGRSAEQWVADMTAEALAEAFRELGDEPEADRIAEAIVRERGKTPITRTRQLADLIGTVAPARVNAHPRPGEPTVRQQKQRPVARVFQALRMLVNRETANLTELLRALPWSLNPGGRAVIISFHSGEDRLVKQAFRDGLRSGLYSKVSDEPVRCGPIERFQNPRSRSAKLRWAERSGAADADKSPVMAAPPDTVE